MDIEFNTEKASASRQEKEELQSILKKVKKSQLAYLKNTEWMFSNPNFQMPQEHISNYL
jgi:hypothetical protein